MSSCRPTSRWMSYLLVSVLLTGCRSHVPLKTPPVTTAPYQREIESPEVCIPQEEGAVSAGDPLTVSHPQEPESWFLTLEEVVQITLANSDVIRDIGGRVVNGAGGVPSVYDPALQEINPGNGVEAALSAFDAQLTSNLFMNKTENRSFSSFITAGIQTSTSSGRNNQFDTTLTKQSMAGTRFSLSNITIRNESQRVSITPNPLDPPFSSISPAQYNTVFQAEVRQPLLQGAGVEFNRIAGPNSTAGNYNGVVLARIRTDIALADFEANVRNLLRDVESAYWNLYFAFRQLDARTAAYEASLASWRIVQDQFEAGTADGAQEALARANFYLSKAAMQNALSGGSGSNPILGVYSAERDLRQLMGISVNDGRLIRPADEPTGAEYIFNWKESLEMALDRRVELRRQKWVIKQRQNELLASKNFLLSQLDLVGQYRWRGVGPELFGNRDVFSGSAFTDLWGGDLQGWQLGLQYSTNIGKRREHAAVRSAELQLARERAVLRNQELSVSNGLSGQFAELDRAYAVSKVNLNRAVAERQRLDAATAKYEAQVELLEFVLQAEQNAADADAEYYRSLVDYNMAVANLHFERGTYLDYMGVQLAEGRWSPAAYRSYSKEFRRFRPEMSYCTVKPYPISRHAYPQQVPARDASSESAEEIETVAPEPADMPAGEADVSEDAPTTIPLPPIDE